MIVRDLKALLAKLKDEDRLYTIARDEEGARYPKQLDFRDVCVWVICMLMFHPTIAAIHI